MPVKFNIYNNSIEPIQDISLYSYQTGDFLSVFDSLNISDSSGSTIADYAIDEDVTVEQFVFNLTMNNNTYIGSSSNDTSFQIIVADFYLSSALETYVSSGSTLTMMNPYTLNELSVTYIG